MHDAVSRSCELIWYGAYLPYELCRYKLSRPSSCYYSKCAAAVADVAAATTAADDDVVVDFVVVDVACVQLIQDH